MRPQPSRFDFSHITESADLLVTSEQAEMARVRYGLFRELASQRRVIEVGCGTGFGLAVASERSLFAVGADIEWRNLERAEPRPGELAFARMNERLAVRDSSVDVVACLEAIYYFSEPAAFLREARRVLVPGGHLLLSFPDSSRPGFVTSPAATEYPSLGTLRVELADLGFRPAFFGGFPVRDGALGQAVRRGVARLGLVPRSLKARNRLKRLSGQRLVPLGPQLGEAESSEALVPIDSSGDEDGKHKVIVVVAVVD